MRSEITRKPPSQAINAPAPAARSASRRPVPPLPALPALPELPELAFPALPELALPELALPELALPELAPVRPLRSRLRPDPSLPRLLLPSHTIRYAIGSAANQ